MKCLTFDARLYPMTAVHNNEDVSHEIEKKMSETKQKNNDNQKIRYSLQQQTLDIYTGTYCLNIYNNIYIYFIIIIVR